MKTTYWFGVVSSTMLLGFLLFALEPELLSASLRARAEVIIPHLVLMLGHLTGGVALWLLISKRGKITPSHLFVIAMSLEAAIAAFIALLGTAYPKELLVATITVSVVSYASLYLLSLRTKTMGMSGLVLLFAVALGVAALAVDQQSTVKAAVRAIIGEPGAEEQSLREANVVDSAFYTLRIVEYADRIRSVDVYGGGIEAFDEGLLLATGVGDFYLLEFRGDGPTLQATQLDLKAPLNRDEFIEDAPEEIPTERFRVADVVMQKNSSVTRLFVSHAYWKRDQECYVMRISTISGMLDDISFTVADQEWETLYETSPCIRHIDVPEYSGHMIGGRMQLLSDDELLVTVGDFGFGQGSVLVERPESSYGKVIRIKISDGSAEPFSYGHRNQQGLVITENGAIWSTEHGPRGGDELNLLAEGMNYGWPSSTFGTAYDRHEWPLEETVAGPDTLQLPVYAWVPSIGISNVIESRSSRFPAWSGNLLVSSLKAKTVFRVHVEDGRAIVVEPIMIGGRIRDLVEDKEGRLVAWTDAGSVLVIEPADTDADHSLAFHTYCSGCHLADRDGRHGIGPNLAGVFGRKIGSAQGFKYSDAMRERSSGLWSEEDLRTFLKDPHEYAPGTSMSFRGLTNEKEMEGVIAYLRTLE